MITYINVSLIFALLLTVLTNVSAVDVVEPSELRTIADVNGDGIEDAIGFGANGVGVAVSNGSEFSSEGLWVKNFCSNQGWNSTKHLRKMADVNGDGMADIVGFGNGGVSVALSDGTSFENANLWVNDFGYDQGWRHDKGLRIMADVNGDGKADIVGFGNAGISVALSDGSSFANAQRWVDNFGYNQGWRLDKSLRIMADVNGDGKADIIGFGNAGVSVALSNGNSFVNAQRWVDDFGYKQGWRNDKGLRYMSDVNGDGKADIVGFGNNGISVALSDGNSFVNAQRWVDNFGYNQGWRNDTHHRYMSDVDGDGKADIVGFGSNGVSVALSDGSSFANDQRWIDSFGNNQGWSNNQHLRLMADVNGDKSMDVVGFGNDGVNVATSLGGGFSSASLWLNDFGNDQGWSTSPAPTADVIASTTILTASGETIRVDRTASGLIFEGYEGKIVLLEIYGDTCPYCVAAIPKFNRLQAKYPNDVYVIAMESYGNLNNAGLQQYATNNSMQYDTVAMENSGSMFTFMQTLTGYTTNQGVPALLILDRDGDLSEYIPPSVPDEDYIDGVVQGLL